MNDKNAIISLIKDKCILYIATKNSNYIRITQEIDLVKKYSRSYKIICFNNRNYLVRILFTYWQVLFLPVKKYDLIFIGFMPQLLLLFMKTKFHDKKVIIDFFISIYDTLVDDRKLLSEKSLAGRFTKMVDIVTLKSADYIIADTKSHASYFITDLNAAPKKMNVLYLEADKNIFYRQKEMQRPKEYINKYVVLFFGSVLPVQGVEVILEAIEMLDDFKDIYFIFIGPIKKSVIKPMEGSVQFIDWVSQEKLSDYISYADLCLAGHFSKTVKKAQRTIPGKAYIYKSMGKPIILGDSPANHELFEENGINNFYVPMGDPAALARCILQCYFNSKNPGIKE
ncbi:glycosyltransferase [Hungatella effluvii]|uniref:glycosyltransferase n=1 Tax=Hungatella effluvii TaxID=1096246 RepID=UPI0022E812CA|nr:glycosyltransferase [Hungatella effluvii]